MTISELQAMSDQELNALAAKLRGWKLLESDHGSWRGVTGNYYFESENGEAECSEGDWTPATDRNQSGARSSARRERDSLTTPPGCRSFLLFRRPFGWAQRGGFR